MKKTGWPIPALIQDDSRPLFSWFAQKLDARPLVRAAALRIIRKRIKALSKNKELP